MAESHRPVGAVAAGLRILRFLAESSEPHGVTAVARALGLNASTCFNILRTLVHDDMVAFDPAAKTYTLGLGVLDLAHGVLTRGGLMDAVHPHMERLACEHAVTVSLWRRTIDDHLVLISVADSSNAVRIHMTVGVRVPVYIGAGGRVIAAHTAVGRSELARAFSRMRWEGPITFDEYFEQVEEARVRGYGVDEGHFAKGVLSVSAPVLDRADEAAMALTALMFQGQHDAAAVERIAEATANLARLIGRATAAGGFD